MTPSQSFHIEAIDSPSGAKIFKLSGALTIQTLFDFQQMVREETAKPIIVDISQVPYMDSAGLGVIMNYFVAAQGAGRKFFLTGVNDRVRALLEMTKVDSVLRIYDSVEMAQGLA